MYLQLLFLSAVIGVSKCIAVALGSCLVVNHGFPHTFPVLFKKQGIYHSSLLLSRLASLACIPVNPKERDPRKTSSESIGLHSEIGSREMPKRQISRAKSVRM